MSVLITGIDMPTKGNPITVLIYPDGTAEWEAQNKVGTAIPVPPHGRLIDADALRAEFTEPNEENGGWRNPDEAIVHKTGVWAAIDAAPTVIPAEEDGRICRNRPITIADCIRAMTDEELAEMHVGVGCPPGTDLNELCFDENGEELLCTPPRCRECWLKWLRQEATP